MITRDQFAKFLAARPGERKLSRLLARDLSLLADVFAKPSGEYVVFKEYQLDHKNTLDYVVFTNRSRMQLVFVEVKGADFPFLNADGSHSAFVGKAIQQIKRRFAYAKQNYWKFRTDAHAVLHQVRSGKRPFQACMGKDLEVDEDKDVIWSGAVIAGYEGDERAISRERNSLEDGTSPLITVDTWQSFVRRLIRT
jgi:hypothetical protein